MSFCKFSPSFGITGKTLVDNTFINDFLPSAPDVCVKVYLLGLANCSNPEDANNNLAYFAEKLKISEEDVLSCFKYWESLGLVQVLSTEPAEVRFLSINGSGNTIKKFKEDKYTNFNIQAQEMFGKRMIMPNEFAEFYYLMENKHFEENALITLIKYCVDNKGFNLNPNYVITVAKDWERDGIHTVQQVESKIEELGLFDDNFKQILSAMGSSRKVQIEDKKLLSKWTINYGFELNVIIYVVKLLKSKKRKLDVSILDECLTRYFENKLISIKEIDNYEQEKDKLYSLAIEVNKQLGVYYEDLTKEIDYYILSWINSGFDAETILLVADNCFKSSIRTLEGLNTIIQKLHKLGITNTISYNQYLSDMLAMDEKIKEVLSALNLVRNVTAIDRKYYSIWLDSWNFTHDIVLYAASLSADKANAMQYLNKILSNWHDSGVKTLEQAKNQKVEKVEVDKNITHLRYSKEQINSLISNLDETEV